MCSIQPTFWSPAAGSRGIEVDVVVAAVKVCLICDCVILLWWLKTHLIAWARLPTRFCKPFKLNSRHIRHSDNPLTGLIHLHAVILRNQHFKAIFACLSDDDLFVRTTHQSDEALVSVHNVIDSLRKCVNIRVYAIRPLTQASIHSLLVDLIGVAGSDLEVHYIRVTICLHHRAQLRIIRESTEVLAIDGTRRFYDVLAGSWGKLKIKLIKNLNVDDHGHLKKEAVEISAFLNSQGDTMSQVTEYKFSIPNQYQKAPVPKLKVALTNSHPYLIVSAIDYCRNIRRYKVRNSSTFSSFLSSFGTRECSHQASESTDTWSFLRHIVNDWTQCIFHQIAGWRDACGRIWTNSGRGKWARCWRCLETATVPATMKGSQPWQRRF